MKKIISTIASFLLLLSLSTAQISEKWEAWSEDLADKTEKLAEKISADAERSASHFSVLAEDFAANISQRFENGDFVIRMDDLTNGVYFSGDHLTGYLGIHSDHISKRKAEKLGFENKYGSYVSRVVKNSAAEEAGLQPFDYIYGVNDQRTSNNQDLTDVLEDFDPGKKVTLHFIRKGQSKTVNVELGGYDDYDWDLEMEEDAFLGVSPSNSERSDDMDGVSVEIINGSAAAEMGLADGDVIKSINDFPILDWDDVTTVMDNLSPGDLVEVDLERDGSKLTKKGNVKLHEVQNKFDLGIKENDWNGKWDENVNDWLGTGGGAFLGVYIEHISEQKARALGFDNPYGSYVTGIIKNTGADKAGMMVFDYIYGIEEYRVGEHQQLGGILKKFETGDKVTVHIYRKGKKISKDLIFLARTEYEKEKKDKCSDPFFGIIELSNDNKGNGIKIKPVNNSTAKDMGLKENDIITHINGYQMYDWMDIGIAINMLAPGDKISVDYKRDGQNMNGSQNITSYAEAKDCKDCDCGEKEDLVIDFGNDFNFKVSPKMKYGWVTTEPNKDVSDIELAIQDLSDNGTNELTSKGIEMPASNDLAVDDFEMSPNSDLGMFELQFDLETEGHTIVKIYNDSGRAIYEYDLGKFSGDFMDNIDISQNGPGTYYLQIVQDENGFVRKIILTNN